MSTQCPPPEVPFGAWASPIDPTTLAAGSVRVTTLVADGADLWWSETRPDSKGRTALMRRDATGEVCEMTPPEVNVRTRVHSYGGGAWWVQDGVLVYSDGADERLRRLGPSDAEPVLLTPESPGAPAPDRYADGRLTADGRWYFCVRESAGDPENVNEIVCVATDGSGVVQVVVSGADFYSDPRPSPCGRLLLWLQWNHPNMPWDGCELHAGRLDRSGTAVVTSRRLAGGPDEWSFGPGWRHDGSVTWVSDGSGASTLWLLEGDPLAADASPVPWVDLPDGEIQTAPWVFGMARHATWPTAADHESDTAALAYAVARPAAHELHLLAPPTLPPARSDPEDFTPAHTAAAPDSGPAAPPTFLRTAPVGSAAAGTSASQTTTPTGPTAAAGGAGTAAPSAYRGHTSFGALRAWEGGVVALAGSPSVENEIVHVRAGVGAPEATVIYAPPALRLDAGFTPEPEPISFPTTDGAIAHALYYRPANPAYDGEARAADERPRSDGGATQPGHRGDRARDADTRPRLADADTRPRLADADTRPRLADAGPSADAGAARRAGTGRRPGDSEGRADDAPTSAGLGAAGATAGGAPPLLVMAHGGPTGAARTSLHLGLRYWTSRGIAVVDVDYRGSTGYGRAYRRALDGGWGVTDVADCVAAARYLADRGDADAERLAIIGASAGGYAVLQALVDYDLFSAGLIRYGVTDLEALARDTHKFEKHYMDRLVGPYPAERELYVARSPIHRADRISCPMLILQGDSDPVVPPNQAEALVAALEANGLPYAYLLFEGEAHGFRGAEAIVASATAELSFLGQIFNFTPAGNIPPITLQNP